MRRCEFHQLCRPRIRAPADGSGMRLSCSRYTATPPIRMSRIAKPARSRDHVMRAHSLDSHSAQKPVVLGTAWAVEDEIANTPGSITPTPHRVVLDRPRRILPPGTIFLHVPRQRQAPKVRPDPRFGSTSPFAAPAPPTRNSGAAAPPRRSRPLASPAANGRSLSPRGRDGQPVT